MESYLVIGGSGFLGRHIVEALVARGDKNVSTFDLVQRYHDVPHYSGDITSIESVSNALQKVGVYSFGCIGWLTKRFCYLVPGYDHNSYRVTST